MDKVYEELADISTKSVKFMFIQINLFGVLFERERKLGSWATFFLKELSTSEIKAKRRNYRQSDE